MKRARNASADILAAAREVTARHGAGKLTIDSVARETGMSKGGVLYNFPSKQALLSALLQDLIEEHLESMSQIDQAKPNATLRGHLHSLAAATDLKADLSMAILAAAAENPELLNPLRQMVESNQCEIATESSDPVGAQVILAALDGLRFQQLLRLPPYDSKTRDAIQDRLESMINDLQ
ncbi:MAG: TetR/AcrR family transcriptional regulator [Roseovarius sp.]|nr:TetR/AcrR family transcriptional regulator [Roseovarius sp.]